jgi:hypothetical protein
LSMRREEAIDTHMCTYTHMHTHTHTHTHTHMHEQDLPYRHTYLSTHTVTHTSAHIPPHTRSHRHTHAHMHAPFTHTCRHTHSRACMHTMRKHLHNRFGLGRLKLTCTNVYIHRLPYTRTAMTAVGFGACKLLGVHPRICIYIYTHTHTPRRPLWAWAPACSDPPTGEHRSSRVWAPAVHTHTSWHSERPRNYRRAEKPSWARVVCTLSAPSAAALARLRPCDKAAVNLIFFLCSYTLPPRWRAALARSGSRS